MVREGAGGDAGEDVVRPEGREPVAHLGGVRDLDGHVVVGAGRGYGVAHRAENGNIENMGHTKGLGFVVRGGGGVIVASKRGRSPN